MKKRVEAVIEMHPYHIDVLVLINQTQKQALKAASGYLKCEEFVKAIEENANCRGITVHDHTTNKYMIWVQPLEPLITHQTIAHEVFHCADWTLRNAGMSLTDESAEAWAYLIGYLTERIYEKLQ